MKSAMACGLKESRNQPGLLVDIDGTGFPVARTTVHTRADDDSFVVSTGGVGDQRIFVRGRTPFDDVPDMSAFSGVDKRVPLLFNYFETFISAGEVYSQGYIRTDIVL